ncbi:MAG: YggT family protein [Candidatus Goldbacteria bacterium]|jgi:uncharacterized protein YggT (Ycf19 family)|nr:YggT family protein [Candidatus Goldiibacteriota bacterium]
MTTFQFAAGIIIGLANAYMILVFLSAAATWLPYSAQVKFRTAINFIGSITGPLLNFVKRIFPAQMGNVDLSPAIAILLIYIGRMALLKLAAVLLLPGA